MSAEIDLADPERALAIAYAPQAARAGLAALFALDERFGRIVAATSEPMIGLMRLAWWRESLEKLDRDPAPAEPLLASLAEHVLPRGVTGAALANIEDGWSALVDGDADETAIARHGRVRGGGLFETAAKLLHADDARLPCAGEVWALVDLAFHDSRTATRDQALAQARTLASRMPAGRWSRAARPLAALYVLAVRDAAGGRRVQGSPGRLLRMLALGITGR